MSSNIVSDFERRWEHVRGMTVDFLEHASAECLDFRPATGFVTVREQARHLIELQGVYHLGLHGLPVDFSTKATFYEGANDTAALIAGLRAKDDELAVLLASFRPDPDAFKIEWFGNQLGLGGYGAVFIQHEALHHGQWALHAKLGGFSTPMSWLLNWGL